MTTSLRLFALEASRDFGQHVAGILDVTLARHEEREFEDGEHKGRPLESVRGCDVYVVHSLYSDPRQSVNDKLVRLLLFVGALRDAGAARITAVIPYLCYARKDQRSKPRDPVSTRYVAGLLESVGAGCVVTLDVHNLAAYENAFRIPTVHLEARKLFAGFFGPLAGDESVVVVSPDVGGVKRAEMFCASLEHQLGRPVTRAFMEKSRSEGVVSGKAFVGDVSGRTAIVIDDLISSGTTLVRAVSACHAHGARRVLAAASHGLFTVKAAALLTDPGLDQLVVTDTVPPFRLDTAARGKLQIISAAPLFAETIRRMHTS